MLVEELLIITNSSRKSPFREASVNAPGGVNNRIRGDSLCSQLVLGDLITLIFSVTVSFAKEVMPDLRYHCKC
jgi:hypothetical protein